MSLPNVTDQELELRRLHLQFRTMEGIAYRTAHAVVDADTTNQPIRQLQRLIRLDAKWRSVCREVDAVGLIGVKSPDHVVDMMLAALRRRREGVGVVSGKRRGGVAASRGCPAWS